MEDGEQVLVEIGGTYELVDRNHLITPETVSSFSSCYVSSVCFNIQYIQLLFKDFIVPNFV